MKKTIYHEGKEDGEYRVLELEKNEKGEIYLRIRHGKKGEKDREEMTTRLGYDELAGMCYRIEKMLLAPTMPGKATIYKDKGEGAYKVSEIEIRDDGAIFFRMSEGVKDKKESRKQMAMRLSEDELAGLWFGMRRILLS